MTWHRAEGLQPEIPVLNDCKGDFVWRPEDRVQVNVRSRVYSLCTVDIYVRYCKRRCWYCTKQARTVSEKLPASPPSPADVDHADTFVDTQLSCCLTSTEAGWPIRDGDRVGRGQGDWLDRGNRPKKTGETVDRRQNNGSVKAVSPRHCPATCALRNCSFNCCAGHTIQIQPVLVSPPAPLHPPPPTHLVIRAAECESEGRGFESHQSHVGSPA